MREKYEIREMREMRLSRRVYQDIQRFVEYVDL